MENKLNREGIKNYSARFAHKALEEFFKAHENISGEQILTVQPIRQINLFVIKNLFREWQKEAVRLRSSYFDYDSQQVKDAMADFMNVLSRNISISRDSFFNLFVQATEETILLIFSPYDFYIHIVERNNATLSKADLERITKYVKVNKNIINLLVRQMNDENADELNGENLPALMDAVFAKIEEGPEDIENYLKEFTKVIPLQVSDLYLNEEAEEVKTDGSSEQKQDSSESLDSETKAHAPTRTDGNKEAPKTLLDELSDTSKTTIAEIHEKRKVESIRDSLSINQRFMFINMLFDGDENSFSETLASLESFDKFYNATNYLKENFPDWDYESEEVTEFMEVLEKRY